MSLTITKEISIGFTKTISDGKRTHSWVMKKPLNAVINIC